VRLSDLLREPDFKKAGIEVIGKWKTVKGSYVVVGPAGQPTLPIDPQLQHPIPMKSEDDTDPEVDALEAASIRRRFGLERYEIKFPR
jgi:hypothetical protein